MKTNLTRKEIEAVGFNYVRETEGLHVFRGQDGVLIFDHNKDRIQIDVNGPGVFYGRIPDLNTLRIVLDLIRN